MRKPAYKIVKYGESLFLHTSGFNLTYIVGNITRARKSTLGVFCFKTKRQAKNFTTTKSPFNITILKVIPIGRGKVPKLICNFGGLKNFYSKTAPTDSTVPPDGTVCYPAVKVLKEVK